MWLLKPLATSWYHQLLSFLYNLKVNIEVNIVLSSGYKLIRLDLFTPSYFILLSLYICVTIPVLLIKYLQFRALGKRYDKEFAFIPLFAKNILHMNIYHKFKYKTLLWFFVKRIFHISTEFPKCCFHSYFNNSPNVKFLYNHINYKYSFSTSNFSRSQSRRKYTHRQHYSSQIKYWGGRQTCVHSGHI